MNNILILDAHGRIARVATELFVEDPSMQPDALSAVNSEH